MPAENTSNHSTHMLAMLLFHQLLQNHESKLLKVLVHGTMEQYNRVTPLWLSDSKRAPLRPRAAATGSADPKDDVTIREAPSVRTICKYG